MEFLGSLVEEIDDILPQLKAPVLELQKQVNNPKYFARFGQIIDRLFGTCSMLDLNYFAEYFGMMKDICYKSRFLDEEAGQQAVLTLMKKCIYILGRLKESISNEEKTIALMEEVAKELKNASTVKENYLYAIRHGSVSIDPNEDIIIIFEKFKKMSDLVMESEHLMTPTPLFASSLLSFHKKLENPDYKITAILIDASLDKEIWLPLLEVVRTLRPGIPIGLVSGLPESFKTMDLKKIGVTNVFKYPASFETLQQYAVSILNGEISFDNHDSSHDTGPLTDKDDHPIELSNFIEMLTAKIHLCAKNPFDIYVKVGNKMLKFSLQNEKMTNEQIQNHKNKNIKKYYVKRDDYEQYLNVCKQEVARITSDKSIDFGSKISKTASLGAETYSYIKHCGIDKRTINEANGFVENVSNSLNGVLKDGKNLKNPEFIKSFMKDLAGQEHAVSVAMLTGLFLESLEAEDDIRDQIILSAFLHDIGLHDASEKIKSENEDEMNDEEKEIFYNHPLKGVELLKNLGLKNVLLDAIERHHMRLDGHGFPRWEKGSVNKVNHIAEVIGLSEELSHWITRASSDESINPLSMVKKEYFSEKIQKAFLKIFI